MIELIDPEYGIKDTLKIKCGLDLEVRDYASRSIRQGSSETTVDDILKRKKKKDLG